MCLLLVLGLLTSPRGVTRVQGRHRPERACRLPSSRDPLSASLRDGDAWAETPLLFRGVL